MSDIMILTVFSIIESPMKKSRIFNMKNGSNPLPFPEEVLKFRTFLLNR